MSAPGVTETPPAAPRRYGWFIATAVASILVLGGAAAGASVWMAQGEPEPVMDPLGLDASEAYDWQEPRLDQPRDVELRFRFSYEAPETGLSWVDDAIGVYLDPALTIPAADVRISHIPWQQWFTVKGAGVSSHWHSSGSRDSVTLAPEGEWALADRYYVVERHDRRSGEPLERPRVTLVEFAPTEDRAAAPTRASFRVDDEGVGHFDWDPVPGASEYLLVRLADDFGSNTASVVGHTTGTSLSTMDHDDDILATHFDEDSVTQWGRAGQNTPFLPRLHDTEDAQRDPRRLAIASSTSTAPPVTYGLITRAGKHYSSMTIATTTHGAAAVLPVSVADTALEELGARPTDVSTIAEIPGHMPIVVADGSTVLRPVVIDLTNVKPIIHNGDIVLVVPFSIEGTMFRGNFWITTFDDATFAAELKAAAQRISREREQSGLHPTFTYSTPPNEMDPRDASRTAPDVPHPVEGTTPLVEYLAANLIAGERGIYVGHYVSTPGTLWDALGEAQSQHPMLVNAVDDVAFDEPTQILLVTYRFTPDEFRAEQDAVAAAVDEVVGTVVRDGMTDRQKAEAINAWLRDNTEYDHEAIELGFSGPHAKPRTWSAAGPLLEGLAVCLGYAEAFKALADAAGVESVVVKGVSASSGIGHAWNKVRIDGDWSFVDPTWNDSPSPDRYLFLTDEQTADTHIPDLDWITDAAAHNYATP